MTPNQVIMTNTNTNNGDGDGDSVSSHEQQQIQQVQQIQQIQQIKQIQQIQQIQQLQNHHGPITITPCNNDDIQLQNRPRRTIYMDGVFDLFHIGHLEAIRHCAKLGNRVIIGITGDEDATGYKRSPIIQQDERIAIISSLRYVDAIVCPCPLIVTEEFMKDAGIDLVVHGFANEDDAKRQQVFFESPMQLNKFQRIPYYDGQSTTSIMQRIQATDETID